MFLKYITTIYSLYWWVPVLVLRTKDVGTEYPYYWEYFSTESTSVLKVRVPQYWEYLSTESYSVLRVTQYREYLSIISTLSTLSTQNWVYSCWGLSTQYWVYSYWGLTRFVVFSVPRFVVLLVPRLAQIKMDETIPCQEMLLRAVHGDLGMGGCWRAICNLFSELWEKP